MKIRIERDALLKPLQQVIGAVERRHTMPVLGNILFQADAAGVIELTATDLEIELHARLNHPVDEPGEATIPARKLMDICKALPEGAEIILQADGDRVLVKSGRSRFSLATLPVRDFPVLDEISASKQFDIEQPRLHGLIDRTGFAMANQDVRYYLNGLMLEVAPDHLRAVATDGHRLAMCTAEMDIDTESEQQVIVPRKGVMELNRLLDGEGEASVQISANHIRVGLDGLRFTSKLIDGRFPDYQRVLPQGGDKEVRVDRAELRQALTRASILSNEKYRGIRMAFEPGLLRIQAHNPEQEEAEEEVAIDYQGEPMEIGFNVNYVLDVLNALGDERVLMTLKDANSSALVRGEQTEEALYVIMPMRL